QAPTKNAEPAARAATADDAFDRLLIDGSGQPSGGGGRFPEYPKIQPCIPPIIRTPPFDPNAPRDQTPTSPLSPYPSAPGTTPTAPGAPPMGSKPQSQGTGISPLIAGQ